MRLDLKPTAPQETIFLGIIAVCIALSFAFLTLVYRHGVIVTGIAALGISWLSMQLFAGIWEERTLWPPSSQFAGFFWGDLIGLPGIAIALCLMRQHHDGDTLADHLWWRAIWLAVGLIVGLGFHAMEAGGTFYSTSQLHSPTKLWHDLFVIPMFVYFFVTQLPLLKSASVATVAILAVSFAFWAGLTFIYDGQHMKSTAHVNYDWRDLKPSRAPAR